MITTPYEKHIAKNRIKLGSAYVTWREKQCIEGYAQGKTRQQIASELRISERTIDKLMMDARIRVEANNLYHLVAMAVRTEVESYEIGMFDIARRDDRTRAG